MSEFLPNELGTPTRRFGGRGTVGFEFQCACCLELTRVKTKKPGRLTPIRVTKTCRVCESVSDLLIEKLKDGGMKVKTTECRPTEEGMKHYYMHHPEKDPDYVQPDGKKDNKNSDKTFTNHDQSDGESDI